MFLCKMVKYRFYMLSMHENGAAKATVYDFVVNYIASICFGSLLFDEVVTKRLCVGVTLILSGTVLISQCKEP
jgi:drug/metabolite transporter (DMT)-like permease